MNNNRTDREWIEEISGHHFCVVCGKKTYQVGDEYEHICRDTGWLLCVELDLICVRCATHKVKFIGFDELDIE